MRRFIITAIGITILLYLFNGPKIETDNYGNTYIEKISRTDEITLNDFIKAFNEGRYSQIKVLNETQLQGYKSGDATDDKGFSSMMMQKNVTIKNYVVEKTEKPAMTSLADLGISLT